VQEFFANFIPFSDLINKTIYQLNEIRDRLIEELKIQGIDIPYSPAKKTN